MAHTLIRTFRPNENGFGFLNDIPGYQSSSNSGATQTHSQGQFRVRNIQAERFGRSSLLYSQPPPLFLVNQGQQTIANVQVSSSHAYLQQENGFPAEVYWQVKRHVKEMVKRPYERTSLFKIEVLRDACIMFWQRVQAYVRRGWMKTLALAFGLVGKQYKRAGAVLYEPVMALDERYLK